MDIPKSLGADLRVSPDHSRMMGASIKRTDSAKRMEQRDRAQLSRAQSTGQLQERSKSNAPTIRRSGSVKF